MARPTAQSLFLIGFNKSICLKRKYLSLGSLIHVLDRQVMIGEGLICKIFSLGRIPIL